MGDVEMLCVCVCLCVYVSVSFSTVSLVSEAFGSRAVSGQGLLMSS